MIPVLVTPQFQSLNIQKEQQLVFILEVDDKGILRTKEGNKIMKRTTPLMLAMFAIAWMLALKTTR
jgi:hypothetical protein